MKTPPRRFLVVVPVSLALFAGAALASAAGPKAGTGEPKLEQQKERDLHKYDLNHDGHLDESERAAMIRERQQEKADEKARQEAERLEKYDLNHDGKLDAAERAAMKADLEKNGTAPKKPAAPKKVPVGEK
jgi:hypothetical protein